jgi:phospholipid/cholesterol/gamma-HCH transport system substrate-binding protein
MEREANYFAVGSFVLLVVTMAGLFVYWYSEGLERRDYVPYEIYFPGSVTGLNVGGSVRYLGVEVGRVRRVRLDPRSPERVQVIADIDGEAPISQETTAELAMMSFATGVLYIDLRRTTEGREVLPAVPSERYPVINTVRSSLDSFINALPDLAGNAALLLERAQQIFSPDNTEALRDLVKNMHAVSERLPATVQHVDSLLADISSTSAQVRSLAASLERTATDMTPEARQIMARLNATAENLEKASKGIEQFMGANSGHLTNFARDGLPQLQRTLEEASSAAAEIRALGQSLKADPSRLIYQPSSRGMEVER